MSSAVEAEDIVMEWAQMDVLFVRVIVDSLVGRGVVRFDLPREI